MKFIKLLCFDIKNGILRNKFLFISALAVSISFVFDFSVRISHINNDLGNYYLGDVIMYVYGGIKEYIPSREERFAFPAIWTILMITQMIGTLNYPYDNLNSFGKQILIRANNISIWWISKCVWNIFYSVFYHMIIWCVILLFCVIFDYEIKLDINTDLLMRFFDLRETDLSVEMINIPIYIFAVPIIMSLAVNLIEMTLSLFIRNIFSFLVMSCLMISSAYIMNFFMIGNCEMLIRNDYILKNGINFECGAIFAFILIILSFVIGAVKFNKYDIINS